ncbi:MAG: site-specific integrase [Methanosarcinales archaeon]|nr:site-specific integrase [Methanosarcinales archaeon]
MEKILNQFHVFLIKQGKDKRVCNSYRNDVRTFCEVCKITNVEQLNFKKASEYDPIFLTYINWLKDVRKNKYKTMCRKLSALEKFFAFLVRYDFIIMDPVPSFRQFNMQEHKTEDSEMRMLPEPKEVKVTLKNSNNIKLFFMIALLAKSGARRQEVIDADHEDFKIERKIWEVKSHPKRTGKKIPLDDELIAIFKIYMKTRTDDCPALFIGKRGRRINKDALREDLTDVFRRCGLYKDGGKLDERLTPHCFRHFQNTQLDLSGLPRGILTEIRGDQRKDIDSCERYIHYNEKNLVKIYNQHKIKLVGKSMRLPRK